MSAQQYIDILTPVGRMVQGNPFIANTTDQYGAPLVHKSGPQQGQPKVNYYVGIAIPKSDPGMNDIFQKMQAAAQQGFPGLFQNGQCTRADFSWKLIDGDGIDSNGQPYSNREGFAGNWILRFQSSFAPKCYTQGGTSVLTDPESIKRGYYIRVYGSTAPNMSTQSPGIYMNLNMVELIAYGEEIVTGPDGAAIFGASPVTSLPPGASTTPVAPATPIAQGPGAGGGYPGQQQAPGPQQQAPAPQQQAPAPQQQTPAPQQQTPAPQQQTPAPQQQTPAPQQQTPAPAGPTQPYNNIMQPAPVPTGGTPAPAGNLPPFPPR